MSNLGHFSDELEPSDETGLVTAPDLLVGDDEDNVKGVVVNKKIDGKIIPFNPLLDDDDKLVYNYYLIHADFQFKASVKYPSIPVFVDQTATVYPLSGRAFLTGAEFLVARNQGCNFNIFSVFASLFLGKK